MKYLLLEQEQAALLLEYLSTRPYREKNQIEYFMNSINKCRLVEIDDDKVEQSPKSTEEPKLVDEKKEDASKE